jgi:hypothetical protein
MSEDRLIIEGIKNAIKDREKTDRKLSFSKYFLVSLILPSIVIILFIIYYIIYLGGYTEERIREASVIAAAISLGVIVYPLSDREKHFERERELLSTLILWFEGKINDSKLSNLRNELRDREIEEEERNLESWKELSQIPFVGSIIGLYVTYFLPKDFYRHDKREPKMLGYLQDAVESLGKTFTIPTKPQSQEIPERNFLKYMALTILIGLIGFILSVLILRLIGPLLIIPSTSHPLSAVVILVMGLVAVVPPLVPVYIRLLYWFYTLFKDPNGHFEYQKEWEDRLLEAIETLTVITSSSDATAVYNETKSLLNAELILPKRNIELADRNMFGKGDFESDLSKEDLDYITKNERGRYHFIIIKQDGVYYIQDVNSTNGTKLNDTEIKGIGKKELKNGDKITLAGINNFMIRFKISGI